MSDINHGDGGGTPGVALPYEPNGVLAWLYQRFFSRITVDPAWVSAVREASARATVVHVMRSQSYLDFVALDFVLKQSNLPPLRFVSDTGLWVLEPMGQGVQTLLRRNAPEPARLERTVSAGCSSLLFMRRPPEFADGTRRGRAAETDHIRVLLDIQRRQSTPVLLLPQVLVWGKSPDTRRRSVVDLLFGPTDYPGRLRVMARFLRTYDSALLRVGDPLDLQDLLRETPDLDDDARVRKVHWTLFRRLDRERRVVLGPIAKGPDRLGAEILRTPRVRAAVQDTALREKRPLPLVQADILRALHRLEARPDPDAIALADVALAGLFRTVFDGVDVDTEGFARIRDAARRGPVVLLPAHRSHVDYLVLSWVCFREGLQTPLIAAGDNLDFWPLGSVLRRGGAFFIRRTMGTESTRLYAVLLDAYVRKMMREGYLIEFFFEGGRSRSGRLLSPRYGLLSIVLDAAAKGGESVSLAPISVVYDRVAEERTYAAELSGRAKQREDLRALLRVPAAMASPHGRIRVDVGDIVTWSPQEAPQGTASTRRSERDRMVSRRAAVTEVAQRVASEIHRVTPVTAMALVATALLSHPGRGMTRLELRDTTDRLVALMTKMGARVAVDVRGQGEGRHADERAIDRALDLLTAAGNVHTLGEGADATAVVPDERRLAVEYYKNNLHHRVAPRAMVALAVSPRTARSGRSRTDVCSRATRIDALLGSGLAVRPAHDPSGEDTLAAMLADGELMDTDGVIRATPDDAPWVATLAGALTSGIEAHRIVARTLREIVGRSASIDDVLRRGLSVGRRMFVAGEIQRREAVSRAALADALTALRELGMLGGGEGGPQRLKAPWDTVDALAGWETELMGYDP